MQSKTLRALKVTFALTLALAALIYVPAVHGLELETYAYISATPNPVGVGQTVLVTFWLDKFPPLVAGIQVTRWNNFTLVITRPDMSTEKLTVKSDYIGAAWHAFTPNTVGKYYLQFFFGGQEVPETGNYYKPSTSRKLELIVQQEPVPEWPPAPLPTDYWERPISAENREWYMISGNWLGVPLLFGRGYNASFSTFNPYTEAPDAAHIVWTKQITFGGLVGGEFGSTSYYSGLSYESRWSPPIIIDGKLYYNVRLSTSAWQGFACVDLRTGQELWWRNDTTLTVGQILNYDSPNQHGAIPYLWSIGATYKMYDAFTGRPILTLTGASTGKIIFSKKGDMLVYVLSGARNWLALWNSTKAIGEGTVGQTTAWRPSLGASLNWKNGIVWNTTVPDVPGTQSIARLNSEIILAASTADPQTICAVGYSAKTGEQLWVTNITSGAADRSTYYFSPIVDGKFAFFKQETMQWFGYNAYTGKKIWGPTKPYENDWGIFSSSVSGLGAMEPVIAYGKLYSAHYDGTLHCIDMETGERLWDYFVGSAGFEVPYGQWPLGSGTFAVADGKVYVCTGEHSPTQPMWRGGKMHVVNATTGEGIWNISGWWESPVVADGYVVAFNNYDGRIYCFGKGKTATAVSASPNVITNGSMVLIQGKVTDQSPGAKGTPAIADEYMAPWMEYVYMQKPRPTDVKGVEVTLDAVAPDGSFIHIGRATADADGMFKKLWQPPSEGEYTIIATFEGSNSYWPSYAETAVGVTAAPPPSATQEQVESTQNTIQGTIQALQPLITALLILVIIAIAIGIYSIYDHRKLLRK